jgi:hypothetical protein
VSRKKENIVVVVPRKESEARSAIYL